MKMGVLGLIKHTNSLGVTLIVRGVLYKEILHCKLHQRVEEITSAYLRISRQELRLCFYAEKSYGGNKHNLLLWR